LRKVEAARAEPVAQVLAAQAREPLVVQAQQAERARGQLLEARNKEWALEALARVEDLRTPADQATPQIRPTDLFRDGRILHHRIHHLLRALITRQRFVHASQVFRAARHGGTRELLFVVYRTDPNLESKDGFMLVGSRTESCFVGEADQELTRSEIFGGPHIIPGPFLAGARYAPGCLLDAPTPNSAEASNFWDDIDLNARMCSPRTNSILCLRPMFRSLMIRPNLHRWSRDSCDLRCIRTRLGSLTRTRLGSLTL
jgi:hypothetical protein